MDLSTKYLGLELPHPFIVGASPLTDEIDRAKRLEDAGAAAVVMRSLFEEQLIGEGLATHHSMDTPSESFPEALTYFPNPEDFVLGPDEYLEHIRRLKEALSIPVIASMNGTTPGGWLDHSKLMEEAGADAVELHVFNVPTDPNLSGEAIERRTIDMVHSVKEAVGVPVAVKLSCFYTSFANLAKRLDDVSADALVLFNRFYHPDINVEKLEVESNLHLSTSAELPLRLRWLALVTDRVKADLAVTGGVHTVEDSVKSLMCGAQSIQLVSAILRNGPQHIGMLRDGLSRFLEEYEYESLQKMCGNMSMTRCPDPRAFNRGDYMQVLQTYQIA